MELLPSLLLGDRERERDFDFDFDELLDFEAPAR